MKSRSYDHTMAELFREKPDFMVKMLNEVLEDGDQGELLIVLRQIALAHEGGIKAISEKVNVNTKSLYRSLSDKGNPEFRTFKAVLEAVGLRLKVQPIENFAGV